ncbi:Short-chain dehydrogenase TIC 32 [Colletotrichum siamense]|nr:Short-chain dehydrogenase TIC 32 [Colletotrichum siamense]
MAPSFNPATDIPSLCGKTIFVTGGNTGLGKQSIIDLARHDPAQIWLAARDLVKAEAAATEIRSTVPAVPIILLKLDLSSVKSIKEAVATFSSTAKRLDILMLNAGIMAVPPGLTEEGYEIQFGTNHVGHALLTKLLLPLLVETAAKFEADVRVVVLSSHAHNMVPEGGINFDSLKSVAAEYSTWIRYGQSKLANALFARSLARHYPQLTVSSVTPGNVDTNLASTWLDSSLLLRIAGTILLPVVRIFASTVEQGAHNQLWASVSASVVSGEYYAPVGVGGKASQLATDSELADELWDWTERELAPY